MPILIACTKPYECGSEKTKEELLKNIKTKLIPTAYTSSYAQDLNYTLDSVLLGDIQTKESDNGFKECSATATIVGDFEAKDKPKEFFGIIFGAKSVQKKDSKSYIEVPLVFYIETKNGKLDMEVKLVGDQTRYLNLAP